MYALLMALILVAHAGGSIYGFEGTNSLEALEESAALGFRYIEVDFIPTSDGHIVLNHSWYHVSNRIPGVRNGIMTHAEFMSHRIDGRFTPMDLPMLIDFLRNNPGIRVITDTKDDDYAALYAIARDFPLHRHRFLPQAYCFNDVARLRALGFWQVIVTVYRSEWMNYPERLGELAAEHNVYALAIPDFMAEYVDASSARFFVHTIDCMERAYMLSQLGFYGIYTGHLGRPWQEAPELMPFVSPLTGDRYVLARPILDVASEYDWQAETGTLHMQFGGRSYTLRMNYGLFLYRDRLFIAERRLNVHD